MRLIATMLLLIFLTACASSPITKGDGKEKNARTQYDTDPSLSDDALILVRYGTNRLGASDDCDFTKFTNHFTETVIKGGCIVSMPVNRGVGELPTDKSSKRDNARIVGRMASNQQVRDKALIFVHGFNVDFLQSIFRAAQIAHDLKWPGDVLVFSWPSGRNCSIVVPTCLGATYQENQKNADKSKNDLYHWLLNISKVYSPSNINILVHSMGHQLVVPVLRRWADEGNPMMNSIFFNAPDYEWSDFIKDASITRRSSRQFTIYCSFKDKALTASTILSNKARLGECENVLGYDVINVSGLSNSLIDLGHGYYYSRPVMHDMKQAIDGVPPEHRLFISRSSAKGSETHFLRP